MREKKQKKSGWLQKQNKTEFLRTFMFLFCFIFILLLTYIVGALLYSRDSFIAQEGEKRINPDEYFKNCQILEKDCLDIDCNYYTRCGDGNYNVCRVYDCGDTFGVFTEDLEGKQDTKNPPKPDMGAILAQKDSCKGTMDILSDVCVEGKEKIKVKIVTEGECKIGNFTVIFEGAGTKNSTFKEIGDSIYEITAIACGKVSKVVPATPNGISLEF